MGDECTLRGLGVILPHPPGSPSALLHPALVPERLTCGLLHGAPGGPWLLAGFGQWQEIKGRQARCSFGWLPSCEVTTVPFSPRRGQGPQEVPAPSLAAPYTSSRLCG